MDVQIECTVKSEELSEESSDEPIKPKKSIERTEKKEKQNVKELIKKRKLSPEVKERQRKLARERKKKYLQKLTTTQMDEIRKKDRIRTYAKRHNIDRETVETNLNNQEEKCKNEDEWFGNVLKTENIESNDEDNFSSTNIFEGEKQQCCGCGLIVSNKDSLIEHIKSLHCNELQIIEQLRRNINIVQKHMMNGNPLIKDDKLNLEIDTYGNSDTDDRKNDIKIEEIICESLQGGKKVCSVCGLILSCKELIECHMKVKHSDNLSDQKDDKQIDEIVNCPICELTLNLPQLFCHVTKEHLEKCRTSFHCEDCGLVYKSMECLRDHYITQTNQIHSNNTKFCDMYTCSTNVSKKETSLNNNGESDTLNKSKIHVETTKMYSCNVCIFTNRSAFVILKHVFTKHINVFQCPLNCPFCDFNTKNRYTFKKHFESMHSNASGGSNQLVCDVCGYITSNKLTFQAHIRNHKKKYECEYCDYTTSLPTSINVHRRNHDSQKPFVCDYEGCNYRSNQKALLTIHNFTHYPEKYMQTCEVCGFKTTNKYIMSSHIKDHRKGRDVFKCIQCPYTTNLKTKFCVHSLKHKDVTKCKMCDFTTKYAQTMRKHMGTKHGIVASKLKCFKNKPL